MQSPFPGIDPYIEAQGRWPDFHNAFLTYARDAIDDGLPAQYAANLEEQVHLVRNPDDFRVAIRPDIAVVRRPGAAGDQVGGGAVATLEPTTIPLVRHDLEEFRETWIEIRRLPELELITVVELLSPSNKVGDGRVEYLARRSGLIDRPVHIVELDLLLGGHRLPMSRPLPPGHFHAIVSRTECRPDAEVYTWTLRDRLPTIPIPLAPPDPEIALRLAPAFEQAYRRGRYAQILRYDAPTSLPLSGEDQAWVQERWQTGKA